MKHRSSTLVLTAALIAAIGGLTFGAGAWGARREAAPVMSPVPTVIAVVDINKVLQGLNQRNTMLEDLRKRVDEHKTKTETSRTSLAAEETKIKSMAEGPAKLAAMKTFRENFLRARFEKDYNESLLNESEVEMLHDLYAKIDAAAETLAKQNGWHMVLASDERIEIPKSSVEEMSQTIKLKRMLFVDPTLDVTADIITYMNNQFAAGR